MGIECLDFIKSCVKRRRIYWTYHVNMRLRERFVPRQVLVDSVDSYEIVEEYPEDRHLPSYLVLARPGGECFQGRGQRNDSYRLQAALG